MVKSELEEWEGEHLSWTYQYAILYVAGRVTTAWSVGRNKCICKVSRQYALGCAELADGCCWSFSDIADIGGVWFRHPFHFPAPPIHCVECHVRAAFAWHFCAWKSKGGNFAMYSNVEENFAVIFKSINSSIWVFVEVCLCLSTFEL